MPYTPEGSYFVRLDAPPETSARKTPVARDNWQPQGGGPVPAHKRRKRKFRIRPVWVLLIAVLSWVGWAYTTPGGPGARVRSWIDHTRGDVAQMSVNPDLHQTAQYFNGLYKTQGSYPDLSQSAVEATPGFGLSMNLVWCSPRDVIITSLSSGGSLSRLLLDGKDLGNVPNTIPCPANLSNPQPWKLNG